MTYNKYADGALAWGECRRSGKRVLRRDMVEDDQIPGMLVARDWYEPRHPQEFPISVTDPEALWKPSPENVSGETAIAALGAAWSPAAVPETLDRDVLTTTTYTLTGSGGYVPYSYQFLRVTGTGSANFSVVQQGVNTFKIRSLSTTPYAVYNLTVLGTVVDFLGQQVTAALNLVLTLASPLPATLALYITQLAPQHLWKWDESWLFMPDTIADTGSVGNETMTISAPASFNNFNPGPDTLNSTKSWEFDSGAASPCIDNGTSPAMGASAVGSFVFFVRRNTIGAIDSHPLFVSDSSPVTDQMRFSIGGFGATRCPEISFIPTPGNGLTTYTTVDPFTANDTWQCVVFVQPNDGTGPKIYVNGTVRATSTIVFGTGSSNNFWWANTTNTRAQMFAGNWGTAGAAKLRVSSFFSIDRVLTATEISNLMTYLPTP